VIVTNASGRLLIVLAALFLTGFQNVGTREHQHHGMNMDERGMVMNANPDRLPRDCDAISREHEFTVEAGTEFARDIPGSIFGYSARELNVAPCSRITVTLINNDDVRHQSMVHGLPKYLYPAGMFHLEAAGGERRTGQFIVPSDNATYLVHCDLAQHMEKGMKAQLVAGSGSGDLWSVPAVSGSFNRASYLPARTGLLMLGIALLAVMFTFWLSRRS